jgi:aspartate ammonia-lyase
LTLIGTGLAMAYRPRKKESAEHDLLGERLVPNDAYYGVHTLRAMENFDISGVPLAMHPELVVALEQVKQAAARTTARRACRKLGAITGLPLTLAADLVGATQDTGAFVQRSGVLKRIAVKLSKTCNDLRLLSSGPQAGFSEISLPQMQAGARRARQDSNPRPAA